MLNKKKKALKDRIQSSFDSAVKEEKPEIEKPVVKAESVTKEVKKSTKNAPGKRSPFDTSKTQRINAVIPEDTINAFAAAVVGESIKGKAPNGTKKNLSYCINEAMLLWLKEKKYL